MSESLKAAYEATGDRGQQISEEEFQVYAEECARLQAERDAAEVRMLRADCDLLQRTLRRILEIADAENGPAFREIARLCDAVATPF
jgi:hypothetical protein